MTHSDASTYLRVKRFLIAESRALDEGDWHTWLALFSAEGAYWMPSNASQQDPLNHVSLIYDDAPLRELRCRRYRDGAQGGALSLDPAPRSLRYLSNLEVFASDAAAVLTARGSLIVAQYSAKTVDTFHARVTWDLIVQGESYLIRRKRVDLLNCDGPLGDILVYL